MRFSTVAASAVLVGFATALPNVVYQTEVVTVTSCPPGKDCPYGSYVRTTTKAAEPEYPTTTPCETTTDAPEYKPKYTPTTTPCDEETTPVYTSPVYHPTTTPCETTTTDAPEYKPKYTPTTTPCDEETTPVYTHPVYHPTTTPCDEENSPKPKTTYVPPPTYPNGTITTYPPKNPTGYPHPSCPGGDYCVPGHTDSPHPYPPASTPSYPVGTGAPHPSYNTSHPGAPSYYPPASEGAASKMGVSIAAVAGAALLVFLA